MTHKPEPFPWTRGGHGLPETEQAYQAFQVYLRLGTGRSLAKAAAKLDKTTKGLEMFSVRHKWVERVQAYDDYVVTADTDGLVIAMAEARDENLELVRKLRNHLSNRLDEFIEKKQDPTIRWCSALTAMAKVEANAFAIRDDSRTTEKLEAIIEKMERWGLGFDAETQG